MSDTKLKPCPFCGGKAEFVKMGIAKDIPLGFVRCTECGIRLRQGNCTEDFARNEWNTRKPMDNIVAQLEEEKDYSYADMDEYGSRYELNLADCDDFFYKGLARAIDIVRKGGAE